MPSGTYKDENRLCKICKRKLRPLKKELDWDGRKYHITCFKELLSDIHNYHKICYSKYEHKKFIAGIPIDEPMPKDGISLDFS
tara:strand:+ start:381 stop:629 length:249 start_codon:yes stop_codon:yes gene_type:complete